MNMLSRRFQTRAYLTARRGCVLFALAGFLAGTIGVPVPVLPSGKDLSRPFPCMHRRCGCQTADQCWKGCCCFTNQEKLAWAAKHGVEPPAYVAAAAKREASPSEKGKSCCAIGGEEESCCAKNSASEAPASTAEQTTAGVEWVLAASARKCQGHAELWLALGAVSPPPAPFDLFLDWSPCGTVCLDLPRLQSVSSEIAAPPPRA